MAEIDQFFAAWNDVCAENPWICDGGVVELSKSDLGTADVVLERIRAKRIESGWGTRALTALLEVADAHGIVIGLGAVPTPFAGLAMVDRLHEWYQRFGFEKVEEFGEWPDPMIRQPQPFLPARKFG
jgi:hypothetical protein